MQLVYLHQFKVNPSGLIASLPAAATFMSSGTTGQQKSTVYFSTKGLTGYKKRSLETIAWALQHHFRKENPGPVYSLIPSIEDWPTSSLARMIHWFGEKYGIHYIKDNESLPLETPIWIFGTAIHFSNLLSNCKPKRLHPGSVLFETGGFKAERIVVEKETLYNELAEFFSIAKKNILSEYGSCELSAQAYEGVWLPGNEPNSREERKFSFYPDVKVSVLDENGEPASTGIGSLVVHDPLRTDLCAPIVTEDLVELDEAGRFTLLGRVNEKKLRGCSLFAESDLQTEKSKIEKGSNSRAAMQFESTEQIDFNVARAKLNLLAKTLTSSSIQDDFIKTLSNEISSTSAARYALQAFLVDPLQQISSNLDEISLNAFSERSPKHWDIILPGNHSVAGWEPLIFGSIFGKSMQVYLPPVKKVRDSIEFFANKILNPSGSKPLLINQNWDPGISRDGAGVLVFGRDSTVAWFKAQNKYVAGHGSHIAGTYCADLDSFPMENFIQKNFCLGQSGCLEARFLVVDEEPTESFITDLRSRFLKFWGKKLSLRQSQALLHENNRFKNSHPGAQSYYQAGSLLPVFLPVASTIGSVLSSTPFCLPILTNKVFKMLPDKDQVTVSVQTCPPPTVSFDGKHQARGLFIP